MTTTTTTTTTREKATRPERRRWALLALPFVLSLGLGRACAATVGDSVAAELVPVARALAPPPLVDAGFIGPPEPPLSAAPLPVADPAPSASVAGPRRAPTTPGDAGVDAGGLGDAGAPADRPTDALYVPARAVRNAIQKGTVSGDAAPGGVRLRGVSGVGAGLVDGDLVTSVEGTPVKTPEAIADVVTGVVLGGGKHVHGIVRRGDRIIAVTVEMPR